MAALALGDHRRDPSRLVFKGGTFLRMCAMADYRRSDDLDFDWVGSGAGFFRAVADALPAAAAASRSFLHLANPRVLRRNVAHAKADVVWNHQNREGAIPVEATLLRVLEVPTRMWPVRRRYSRMPNPATIRGYTLEMVIADKLSCISQRVAPRDFYDIVRLLDHGADMDTAWSLYTQHFNNPRRTYSWRPFPTDIRRSYAQHLPQFARRWETSVAERTVPPTPHFVDLYTRVDTAVSNVLGRWQHELNPAHLHRIRQAHNRLRPRRRPPPRPSP